MIAETFLASLLGSFLGTMCAILYGPRLAGWLAAKYLRSRRVSPRQHMAQQMASLSGRMEVPLRIKVVPQVFDLCHRLDVEGLIKGDFFESSVTPELAEIMMHIFRSQHPNFTADERQASAAWLDGNHIDAELVPPRETFN